MDYSLDLLYARYAQDAYDTADTMEGTTHTIRIGNCRAKVSLVPNNTIIAIAGTNDISDIKEDLSATLWKENSFRIHRGFRDHAANLYSEIIPLGRQAKHIVLTGHSLGGGAATVIAQWLSDDLPKTPIELYTYGSPRVGWRSFRNILRVPHRRWVNDNDIVPRMPPWILGYVHHGDLFYINRHGELGTPNIINRLIGHWDSPGGIIEDHYMENYCSQIERLVKPNS